MTNVTVMNTGEGHRIVQDVNNRPHSFPCGMIGVIDMHEAHIKMLRDPSKSRLLVVPEDAVLEERFIRMMEALRDMGARDYNENLAAMRSILGKNAMRQRPDISEIRARYQRLAAAYAIAGFAGFDDIAGMEEKRGENEENTRPNDTALRAADDLLRKREVRLNVPRHVREQMAEMERRTALVADVDAAEDVMQRRGKRTILGRVPTPERTEDSPRPVVLKEMPTASPGAKLKDTRSPAQVIADIEKAQAAGHSVVEAGDDVDDETDDTGNGDDFETEGERAAREARTARADHGRKAAKRPAKKAAKKAVKKAPAKKATKKAGNRR